MSNLKKQTTKRIELREVVLCGTSGCCPTVTFNDNEVVIKDDFGGLVKLTDEQFKELKKTK